jgi:hypothetical protein
MWGLLFLFFLWVVNFRHIFLNGSADDAQVSIHRIFGYSRILVTVGLFAAIFYLNYYFLIPRYLSNKKFKKYAGSIVSILLVVSGISYLNRPEPPEFMQNRTPPPARNLGDAPNFERFEPPKRLIFFSFGDLLLSVIALTISTSIRGTREWFENEKQLKDIENQKLTAELSYLKAQINPHFFFNTLNGIYALARKKSDHTPDVILKLSDLMRYIIYEANTAKVLLSREISHIENYIELQRIRLNEIVQVHFQVHGNAGFMQIEPLLFSVFLENAFKHGIDYSRPGKIDISLTIKEHQLIFMIANPILQNKKETQNPGSGLGLENIRQRLHLVYPDRHNLKIYQKDERHIVELHLNITTDEVYNN